MFIEGTKEFVPKEGELVVVQYGGPPVIVTRRLRSSRTSGPYYLMGPELPTPRWGLNDSPYEPLFKVESSRFAWARLEPRLSRELETGMLPNKSEREAVYDLPVPRKLLAFWRPGVIILAVGNCLLPPMSVHRVNEVFFFDPERTIDIFAKRKAKFQALDKKVNWSPLTCQGHLQICKGDSSFTGEDVIFEQAEEKVVLFNHLIEFNEKLFLIRVNNEVIISCSREGNIILSSYDHDPVVFWVQGGRLYKLSHPWPQDEVDSD